MTLTCDQASLELCSRLEINIEQAIRVYKQQRVDDIFSSIAQLQDRCCTFNDSPNADLSLYKVPVAWLPVLDTGYLCCRILGEICDPKTGRLQGSNSNGKIVFKQKQRSHWVLEACGYISCDGDTADHIDFLRPLFDGISNLRWASRTVQNTNKRKQENLVKTSIRVVIKKLNGEIFGSYDSIGDAANAMGVDQGSMTKALQRETIISNMYTASYDETQYKLPEGVVELGKHPVYNIWLADNGLYRTSSLMGRGGQWRQGSRLQYSTDYCSVKLTHNGSTVTKLVHRLMIETVLGRELEQEEFVDHKNSQRHDNRISNLMVTNHKGNVTKAVFKMVSSTDKTGNIIIFLSFTNAASFLHSKLGGTLDNFRRNIGLCAQDRIKTAYGYVWRLASREEIEYFFKMVPQKY